MLNLPPPYGDDPASVRRIFQAHARLEAQQRYDRLRARAIGRQLWGLLSGRPHPLLRLADLPNALLSGARRLPATQPVPIARIVGSDSRSADFDRSFAPLQEHTRERWVSIAALWYEGRHLPPVQLAWVGDDYYVLDGHHRISVARAFGETMIDAIVTLTGPAAPAALPACACPLPA